jgi:hypothetical protein
VFYYTKAGRGGDSVGAAALGGGELPSGIRGDQRYPQLQHRPVLRKYGPTARQGQRRVRVLRRSSFRSEPRRSPPAIGGVFFSQRHPLLAPRCTDARSPWLRVAGVDLGRHATQL